MIRSLLYLFLRRIIRLLRADDRVAAEADLTPYREIGAALLERGVTPVRAKAWNPVVLGRMLKRHSST